MASDTATATTRAKPGSGKRSGWRSPLTRRILAVNVLALGLLGLGLLYLGQYQASLISTELASLKIQGQIFAAALGEGAVLANPDEGEALIPELGRQMMRRLVEPTSTRARLFDLTGDLIADSRVLRGPGGVVQVNDLPPLETEGVVERAIAALYGWVVMYLPWQGHSQPYVEKPVQTASDYPEVGAALAGDIASAVRSDEESNDLVLVVAVPVQRYKEVLGAVLITSGGGAIELAVRDVRFEILKVFLIVLAVTTALSIYLAGTIVRPIRRLAIAAEGVRHGRGARQAIPDLTGRGDEIGDLSEALHEMTNALWQRMDAIESFAADVAHEIKNPLTSLRSAIETAARVEDPVKQKKLLAILREDVQRLDRLITDISDASRLDAELSRVELEPVPLGRMLEALIDVHQATAAEGAPRLLLTMADGDLPVLGIESRLGQVFRNLIANAVSFSPPHGTIHIQALARGAEVVVLIEDEGPGIPEGKLGAIFERFYSERPAGEKFGTHSGLGLSISKQIVDAHHGALHAENRCDVDGTIIGARFVVTLPRAS
ncbi:MAG TPA: stimulus-sensing domain-containing protein [Stellaceae bacterium]|nr:stimulus-sensing domain-containing protein [Stellaceae bacterium]